MKSPNLTRIVDTYVPVTSNDLTGYLNQLRVEVLPPIRQLQADHSVRWFSFLIHNSQQLAGREPEDGRLFIHIRLEPEDNLAIDEFVRLLPSQFLNPIPAQLSSISGLEGSALRDSNWAEAWRIHGEASEWILGLVEGYENGPSLEHVIQYLHFFTNPLLLGHRCLCIPAGFISF